MSEELQEQQINMQLESTTDNAIIYSSLLFDSVENTKADYVGRLVVFKKWVAYSLALGILTAVGTLLVVEFLSTRSPKLAVDTYTGWNEVSPRPLPRNSFTEQSSTVQDQLMNILDNIEKKPIVPPDSSVQNVPIIESAVPTAIHLDKTKPYVPARMTSLPTTSEGPNLSAIDFPTVYHPQQEALVTKPIITDPYNISNYGTYKLTIYSEDSQHIIVETLLTVVPQIEICIPKQFIVRDSVNNLIAGGKVTLKLSEEDAVTFTGTTDQNGTVNLPETLANGVYEVEIFSPNNSKLQHLNFTMVVFQNRRQEKAYSFIGRVNLKPNEMEIILKWAAEPRDLDSHLYSSDGKHVYFGNRNVEYMSLDYDVLSGYGPETVRFAIKSNLKYIYAVYYYEGLSTLTQSRAELMFSINTRDTHINRFGKEDKLINGEKHSIPEIARPQARFWIVFMIDGATKQITFFENTFEDHNDYITNAIGIKYFTT